MEFDSCISGIDDSNCCDSDIDKFGPDTMRHPKFQNICRP